MNELIAKIKNLRQITKKERKIFIILYIVISIIGLSFIIPGSISLHKEFMRADYYQTITTIANNITNNISYANDVEMNGNSDLIINTSTEQIQYTLKDGSLLKSVNGSNAEIIFSTSKYKGVSIHLSFDEVKKGVYMTTILLSDKKGKELVKQKYAAHSLVLSQE